MNLEEEFNQIKKGQQEILSLLKNITESDANNDKEKLYDLFDLEKLLHVSRRTLFKWKSEQRLSFIQIGKKIFVQAKELQRFLDSNNLNNVSYGRK